MRTLIFFLFISLSTSLFAQENDPNKNMKVEMTREAYYPSGDKVFYTYVFNNLKYSEEARAAKAEGEVMVSFFVEPDSTLSNIKILSDVGYGVGDSVRALMTKLKYVPALINGVPLRSKLIVNVPVRAR